MVHHVAWARADVARYTEFTGPVDRSLNPKGYLIVALHRETNGAGVYGGSRSPGKKHRTAAPLLLMA